MKKDKPRKNPEKTQNLYGGDFECINYDTTSKGKEFCHDEGQSGWGEFVKWAKIDNKENLICKGNRHNCNKERLKWLASLSENNKNKLS